MSWLSYFPFALIVSTLVSVVLWWIIRRLLDPQWLPILKILPVPKKQKPSFALQAPPWLLFLCFLLLVVSLIVSSLQNEKLLVQKEVLSNDQVGVVVDLSPSVSAGLDIQKYRKKIIKALKPWLPDAQILIYQSDTHKVSEARTTETLQNVVGTMNFHRFGFQVVDGVKLLRQSRPSLKHIFIFSDGARSSWESFQWKFFDKQLKLSFRQAASPSQENLYIKKVTSQLQLDGSFVKWTAEVTSNKPSKASFDLKMKNENGVEIASTSVSMSPGLATLNVDLPVAREKLTTRISIHIEANDSMQEDNVFHAHGLRFGKTVGVVSASEG